MVPIAIKLPNTDKQLELPEYWEKLNTLPTDPPVFSAFGYFTDQAICVATLAQLPQGHHMPQNFVQMLEYMKPALAESQGSLVDLIIDTSFTGVPYVYTIVKFPKIDEENRIVGVQYALTSHFKIDDKWYVLQGQFGEGSFTGRRDAVVTALMMSDGKVKLSEDGELLGWFTDKYGTDDENTMRPANLSDGTIFDEKFTEHPLSLARKLVALFTDEHAWIPDAFFKLQ